jgi:hypothetical protein
MNLKAVFLRNGATLCALVFLSQLLSGCLSDEEKMQRAEQKRIKYAEYLVKNAAKYKDTSDRALCMNWMTTYSGNVHQRNRKAEINRRKLDCWEYGNVAEEQRYAQCEFDNALAKLARRSQTNCRTGYSKTNVQSVSRKRSNAPVEIDNRCIQDGGTQMCYDSQSQRYGNN